MHKTVIDAFKKVDPQKGIRDFNNNRGSWITLFNYYNHENEKNFTQVVALVSQRFIFSYKNKFQNA